MPCDTQAGLRALTSSGPQTPLHLPQGRLLPKKSPQITLGAGQEAKVRSQRRTRAPASDHPSASNEASAAAGQPQTRQSQADPPCAGCSCASQTAAGASAGTERCVGQPGLAGVCRAVGEGLGDTGRPGLEGLTAAAAVVC